MATNKKPTPSKNKSISINGDVRDSNVFIGDNNLFQKIINYILPSEKETLEQRNRRILLNHVENAWIKGVLDASLYGAAMLDLGIKETPEAITNKYPWTLKKESTDETLSVGTCMLEIFDSIGMGRSLLILGAPGSGKTTMLLELTRGLIARARADVTQSIPMVFNLASWTENLTLADWLAQELNNMYSVPRKTAPDWVKGNKLLLLLDGLDEVRQESRAKCVEAINEFRKQNGLTSLAVCSRSQDYADLKAKLAFEGAIEVQPLTQEQITEFFNRFGDETAGIKQALDKDIALRELAETPLFLSIMMLAYRDKRDVEVLISGDEKVRRKHLFGSYIERMFEHPRSKNATFKKQDVLHWLSWLAQNMITHNQIAYLLEKMQPMALSKAKQIQQYNLMCGLISGLGVGLMFGLIYGCQFGSIFSLIFGLVGGVIFGLAGALIFCLTDGRNGKPKVIFTVDTMLWNWNEASKGLIIGLINGLCLGLGLGMYYWLSDGLLVRLTAGLSFGLYFGLYLGLCLGLYYGLTVQQVDKTTYPGQKLVFTSRNLLFTFLLFGLLFGLFFGSILGLYYGIIGGRIIGLIVGLSSGLSIGLIAGMVGGMIYGGFSLIQHYTLRLILARNNLLPWRLIPFLDHCVDLIFLRRVGGGYIFVHRLLMEHFAEMYVETPALKGK